MSELSHYEKTGYLHDDFKIFHLKDTSMRPIDFHYHDFHKILIFRKGNISYNVEGRTYDLIPGDIVFVPAGTVHRPVLHSSEIYERIIIYISRHYLDACHDSDDLSLCLKEAHQKKSHVLRIPALKTTQIARIIHDLEQSLDSREYANELYHKLLFLELMVQLNRAALSNRIEYLSTTASNHKMINVIDYLNAHLTDDITIDFLAEHFYLSRYHLMHAFKEETGYTIGNYLTTKRLCWQEIRSPRGNPSPPHVMPVVFTIIPPFPGHTANILAVLPENSAIDLSACYILRSARVLISAGISCFFLDTTFSSIIP